MAYVKFSDGNKIPALGLGTFTIWQGDTDDVRIAVETAIDVGYRHIDCAFVYSNEEAVGKGIKNKIDEGVIKRDELFVTSKLWCTHHRPGAVRPAIEKSLSMLQLSYLDLYLVHWPMSYEEGEAIVPKDDDGKTKYEYHSLEDTWKAMEDLVDAGLTKSIGISNFNISQIDRMLKCARIKPVNLQIELHPYLTQEKLVKYCHDNGIAVTGFAPLGAPGRTWKHEGEPNVLIDPVVVDIAKKKGKSPAQIAIKYALQRGLAVVPKSIKPGRIRENFEVQDFQLNEEEMAMISNLNTNSRAYKEDYCLDHPDHPYKDELA